MNVKSRHGASYFLTYIDDYTRYGYVQLIAHHYETLDCFKHFVAEVENQHEKSLKTLWTDLRGTNTGMISLTIYVKKRGYTNNLLFQTLHNKMV